MANLSTTQTNLFSYTGEIVTVTVGTAGYYDIRAEGAQGGGSFTAGWWARRVGERGDLPAGGRQARDRRRRRGRDRPDFDGGGGGGGGSFVFETATRGFAGDADRRSDRRWRRRGRTGHRGGRRRRDRARPAATAPAAARGGVNGAPGQGAAGNMGGTAGGGRRRRVT